MMVVTAIFPMLVEIKMENLNDRVEALRELAAHPDIDLEAIDPHEGLRVEEMVR